MFQTVVERSGERALCEQGTGLGKEAGDLSWLSSAKWPELCGGPKRHSRVLIPSTLNVRLFGVGQQVWLEQRAEK